MGGLTSLYKKTNKLYREDALDDEIDAAASGGSDDGEPVDDDPAPDTKPTTGDDAGGASDFDVDTHVSNVDATVTSATGIEGVSAAIPDDTVPNTSTADPGMGEDDDTNFDESDLSGGADTSSTGEDDSGDFGLSDDLGGDIPDESAETNDIEGPDSNALSDTGEADRKASIAKAFITLYDKYDERVKAIDDMELPRNLDGDVELLLIEYKRINELLDLYITGKMLADSSAVALQNYGEFRFLYATPDDTFVLLLSDEEEDDK